MEKRKEIFEKFCDILKQSNVETQFVILQKGKKAPVSNNGKLLLINSCEEAKKYFEEGYNIGIRGSDNFVIIDLDMKNKDKTFPSNRQELLLEWLTKFGDTLVVRTQSGGYHIYCKTDIPLNFDYNKGNLHIFEVRGKGRYVVAPGSIVNGNIYEIVMYKPLSKVPEFILHTAPESSVGGVAVLAQGEATATPLNVDEIVSESGVSLKALRGLNDKISRLLINEKPIEYPSRSEADQALADILYYFGFSYKQFKAIMNKYRPYKHIRNETQRENYLKRSWQKAISFVKERYKPKPQPTKIDIEIIEDIITKHINKYEEFVIYGDKITDKVVDDLVEKVGGWVKEFYSFVSKYTDAYKEYTLTAGLFGVSALLQKYVDVIYGINKLGINLYTLLLGRSSYSHKTTVIDNFLQRNFLERVNDIYIYPTEGSPEGILMALSDEPNGIFVLDEFSKTLQLFSRSYGAGLPQLFLKVYDGASEKRKLTKQEYVIKNPRVSLISATTPVQLLSKKSNGEMVNDLLLNGFFSRFLIVYPERKKNEMAIRSTFEVLEDSSKVLEKYIGLLVKIREVIEGSSKISKLLKSESSMDVKLVFSVSDEKLNKYDNELKELLDEIHDKVEDMTVQEFLDTLKSRYLALLVKLAVIIFLNRGNFDEVKFEPHEVTENGQIKVYFTGQIKDEYLDIAFELLRVLYIPYAVRFAYRVTTNVQENLIERAREIIRVSHVGLNGHIVDGAITRSRLLREMKIKSRELDEIISTLIDREDVKAYAVTIKNSSKTIAVYTLYNINLKKLLGSNFEVKEVVKNED